MHWVRERPQQFVHANVGIWTSRGGSSALENGLPLYVSGFNETRLAPLASARRHPLSAYLENLAQAQRIIALSRIEHEPMIKHRFPDDVSVVDY
jgi:hypothetical protein